MPNVSKSNKTRCLPVAVCSLWETVGAVFSLIKMLCDSDDNVVLGKPERGSCLSAAQHVRFGTWVTRVTTVVLYLCVCVCLFGACVSVAEAPERKPDCPQKNVSDHLKCQQQTGRVRTGFWRIYFCPGSGTFEDGTQTRRTAATTLCVPRAVVLVETLEQNKKQDSSGHFLEEVDEEV